MQAERHQGTERGRQLGARPLGRALAFALLVGVAGCAHTRPGSLAGQTTGRSATSEAELHEDFEDPALLLLLSALGYEPELVADGSISFLLDRGRVVLFNQWGGDLQLYYVVTGGAWDTQQVNEWNRTRRLCRAYLDKDGDLVLEADLLALGGLTEHQVASFVSVFDRALTLFVTEVATTDAAGRTTPSRPEPDPEPEQTWR